MNPGGLFGQALHDRQAGALSLARYVPSLPAHKVPEHRHAEAHFVAIESGHYLSSAEGAAAVTPGAPLLVFNPPSTEHRDCFAPGQVLGEARFVVMNIGWPLWQPFDQGLDLPQHATAWTAQASAVWLQRMQQVLQLPDATPLDAEGLAAELAGAAAGRVEAVLRSAAPWLRRAREALRDDPAFALAPAGLQRLARELGVHPVHLARAFRRCFGQTPGAYARQRRLQAAVGLLLHSGQPLAELAVAAGYCDQAHFTRAFSASFGVAPARWRRLHRR